MCVLMSGKHRQLSVVVQMVVLSLGRCSVKLLIGDKSGSRIVLSSPVYTRRRVLVSGTCCVPRYRAIRRHISGRRDSLRQFSEMRKIVNHTHTKPAEKSWDIF